MIPVWRLFRIEVEGVACIGIFGGIYEAPAQLDSIQVGIEIPNLERVFRLVCRCIEVPFRIGEHEQVAGAGSTE